MKLTVLWLHFAECLKTYMNTAHIICGWLSAHTAYKHIGSSTALCALRQQIYSPVHIGFVYLYTDAPWEGRDTRLTPRLVIHNSRFSVRDDNVWNRR